MAKTSKTFNRKEKKYHLTREQMSSMIEDISGHFGIADEYGTSDISSVYLDTPEITMISRSLEKPIYKEKLRIRVYNHENKDVLAKALATKNIEQIDESGRCIPVFAELKKKFRGVVYKRRVRMSLGALMMMLFYGMDFEDAMDVCPLTEEDHDLDGTKRTGEYSYTDIQIAREIVAAYKRQSSLSSADELIPAVVIDCHRLAYLPCDLTGNPRDDELRITFDEELSYAVPDKNGNLENDTPLLLPGEAIMEIKSCGAYPKWLVELLNANKVYPSSFSKCGSAMMIEKHPIMYEARRPHNASVKSDDIKGEMCYSKPTSKAPPEDISDKEIRIASTRKPVIRIQPKRTISA